MNWIDNDRDFASWCDEAQRHGVIGVDTEFVWTSTYYPALGLLQMAWDHDRNAIVDVLAITDTAPLRALLENGDVVKVLHEAGSDLPILRRWCGALPRRIVDTRYAAAFCGLGLTMSLNRLLTAMLGVTLPKTETRTDWLQRPLTPAQLDYATGDVDYMPELHHALLQRIAQHGNTDWFHEEMLVYEDPEFYAEPPVEDAWKRVSNIQTVEGTDLNIAIELATWREQHGRTHNLARNRMLRDEQLLLCAQRHPKSNGDLVHDAHLWPKTAERFGPYIITAIQRGLAMPARAHAEPRDFQVMDRNLVRSRVERLRKLVAKRTEPRAIAPELIGARRDFEHLVHAAERHEWPGDSRLLNGWRHELLGDTLDDLIRSNFAD